MADASHELRTPLTALGAVVDVTMAKRNLTANQLEQMARDIRTLLQESDPLIASLLLLAHSDAGVLMSERVDLAALADDALNFRAADLSVERRLEPAVIGGDPVLVQRAVMNLVENAVVHNDQRRWISTSRFATESEAGLTIENTGAVLAPSEAALLFRPFYRAEGRVGSGHGLGLAIVRSVALAHGGRCCVQPRLGGGLAVTMVLPIAGRTQISGGSESGSCEPIEAPRV